MTILCCRSSADGQRDSPSKICQQDGGVQTVHSDAYSVQTVHSDAYSSPQA